MIPSDIKLHIHEKTYWLTWIHTFLCLLCAACGVYSFQGASIPAGLKTIYIPYFENNASMVVGDISQLFTETLKKRIRSQTSLHIVNQTGDALLEGDIKEYKITTGIMQASKDQQAPIADLSRLIMTVHVKYTNGVDPKLNFEESFTTFEDFLGAIASQETALNQRLSNRLSEQIFNRAFANW